MTLKRFLKSKFGDERGSVTVEFVLSMPILFGAIAVAYATFDAFLQFSRASKAMYTTSDIVSRYGSVNQERIDQLQQLYASTTTSPDGSIIRVTRLDFIEKVEGENIQSDGFETEDGFYEVNWSLASPLGAECVDGICGGHPISYPLTAEELDVYSLPGMGDGAHVVLVDVYTPYDAPLPNGTFGVLQNFNSLSWNMNNFVWPRHVTGISLDTSSSS